MEHHDKKRKADTSSFLSDSEVESIHSWVDKFGKNWFKTSLHKKYDAKKALKLNYKIIGFGFNRLVYDLNNGYVLKVAVSPEGYISNENEYDIYRNCDKQLKGYLCPVIERGHGWIVMKKMKTSLIRAAMDTDKLILLQLTFLKHGIIPIDLRLANVAFTEENEMVAVDYGLFTTGGKTPLRFLAKLL
ncbi:hypothetical protein [Peribacillus sp. SCS-155]|uniref:hypothetical protein n=1 Tax=Peribacillus sedimenti TaxID=3115297 RepID=UPI0039061A5E